MIRLKTAICCIKRPSKKVKEDPGFIFPLILALVLIVFIVMALVFEGMQFQTLYNQCDQAVERSVIGVATENWKNVYQTVREGYASGMAKDDLVDAWEERLSKENILKETISMLELEEGKDDAGDKIYRRMTIEDDGSKKAIYYIKPSSMEATIRNVPTYEEGVSNVGTGKGLEVEVTYDIYVEWSYIGATEERTTEPMKITRTVIVKYTPQF